MILIFNLLAVLSNNFRISGSLSCGADSFLPPLSDLWSGRTPEVFHKTLSAQKPFISSGTWIGGSLSRWTGIGMTRWSVWSGGGRNGGPRNGILNVFNHSAVARRFFPRLLPHMPVIPNEQSLSVRRICEMRDLPEQAEIWKETGIKLKSGSSRLWKNRFYSRNCNNIFALQHDCNVLADIVNIPNNSILTCKLCCFP